MHIWPTSITSHGCRMSLRVGGTVTSTTLSSAAVVGPFAATGDSAAGFTTAGSCMRVRRLAICKRKGGGGGRRYFERTKDKKPVADFSSAVAGGTICWQYLQCSWSRNHSHERLTGQKKEATTQPHTGGVRRVGTSQQTSAQLSMQE